ncbi:hypothetical protein [Streptomyces sp. NPDC057552]|uniref:hypothetical protein n=1 Tax=Streptomyces sp. NPDC057552 TaxID=3350537 RepID=UPI00368B8481
MRHQQATQVRVTEPRIPPLSHEHAGELGLDRLTMLGASVSDTHHEPACAVRDGHVHLRHPDASRVQSPERFRNRVGSVANVISNSSHASSSRACRPTTTPAPAAG